VIESEEFVEPAPGFSALGFLAFTTTRAMGSLGLAGSEPVRAVMTRWTTLRRDLAARGIHRLATAGQVHGRQVLAHVAGWTGWLRADAADGHLAPAGAPTAVAVTVADCVPIFVAHPSGTAVVLHSGWRGTEAGILDAGLDALAEVGCPASELTIHLGPAICGRCYEVSPDVFARLTGRVVAVPTPVDLRALIAERARARGVPTVTTSPRCTRCDNARFFSHRAGDAGRQISLMARLPVSSA
jgi:copper oxidase (laccase) domain-containing protein